MGVWVHPQLGLLCGAALPGPFFSLRKAAPLRKTHFYLWFSNDFELILTWFAINSRNHYQNRHPDPYRILVGTLNPWNGRPRVVPWPILFERVAKKCLAVCVVLLPGIKPHLDIWTSGLEGKNELCSPSLVVAGFQKKAHSCFLDLS